MWIICLEANAAVRLELTELLAGQRNSFCYCTHWSEGLWNISTFLIKIFHWHYPVSTHQGTKDAQWRHKSKKSKMFGLPDFLTTAPKTPGGATIVKISWFLYLFLIFLSGGAPNNFFQIIKNKDWSHRCWFQAFKNMICCPIWAIISKTSMRFTSQVSKYEKK